MIRGIVIHKGMMIIKIAIAKVIEDARFLFEKFFNTFFWTGKKTYAKTSPAIIEIKRGRIRKNARIANTKKKKITVILFISLSVNSKLVG